VWGVEQRADFSNVWGTGDLIVGVRKGGEGAGKEGLLGWTHSGSNLSATALCFTRGLISEVFSWQTLVPFGGWLPEAFMPTTSRSRPIRPNLSVHQLQFFAR